jgi:hypothetical protein
MKVETGIPGILPCSGSQNQVIDSRGVTPPGPSALSAGPLPLTGSIREVSPSRRSELDWDDSLLDTYNSCIIQSLSGQRVRHLTTWRSAKCPPP